MALTSREVTELYLYGNGKPSDLIDDRLIRFPLELGEFGATAPVQDMNEYMTTGAGRFAVGRQFNLVNQFFNADTSVLTAHPDFEYGKAYEKADIARFLGIDASDKNFDWVKLYQTNYRDNTNDYAERVYIYNTGLFKIADEARFTIMSPDGSGATHRFIDNFSIKAFDEDFDFKGDGLATVANWELEDAIDPSQIGQTVEIPIRGDVPESRYDYNGNGYYDGADHFHELALMNSWSGFSLSLLGDMEYLIYLLWNDGTIKFLDANNRPIIYGTVNNNNLTDDSYEKINLLVPHIEEYVDNGVVLLGGDGADILTGNSKGDELYGGSGVDDLTGGAGNDAISGGGDNDTLTGSSGTKLVGNFENDILIGDDGADKFVLGNTNGDFYLYGENEYQESGERLVSTSENPDYAIIIDFNKADGDLVQLSNKYEYYKMPVSNSFFDEIGYGGIYDKNYVSYEIVADLDRSGDVNTGDQTVAIVGANLNFPTFDYGKFIA